MDILQAEVGGDQGFMTARNRNHRTVVPDADDAVEPGARMFCGPVTDPVDQGFLRQRHGAINIQASM
jgi:hypothetical protein